MFEFAPAGSQAVKKPLAQSIAAKPFLFTLLTPRNPPPRKMSLPSATTTSMFEVALGFQLVNPPVEILNAAAYPRDAPLIEVNVPLAYKISFEMERLRTGTPDAGNTVGAHGLTLAVVRFTLAK